MNEKFDDKTLKEWAEPCQHIGVPAFVELLTQRQILAREVLHLRHKDNDSILQEMDLNEDS